MTTQKFRISIIHQKQALIYKYNRKLELNKLLFKQNYYSNILYLQCVI